MRAEVSALRLLPYIISYALARIRVYVVVDLRQEHVQTAQRLLCEPSTLNVQYSSLDLTRATGYIRSQYRIQVGNGLLASLLQGILRRLYDKTSYMSVPDITGMPFSCAHRTRCIALPALEAVPLRWHPARHDRGCTLNGPLCCDRKVSRNRRKKRKITSLAYGCKESPW